MQLIHQVQPLRTQIAAWRQQQQSIVLVPTMGNLHEGHRQLVAQAQQLGQRVVVSIFVNPLQFGQNEDFGRYPRTLPHDCELLAAQGVDAVFAPDVAEVYPNGMSPHTLISVPQLNHQLCGAFRPGHFDGVATVVAKLFNLVQPDIAIFGEKDFQQLAVIRAMVRDLALPIRIESLATVREPSGLALSSRNGYLNPEQKHQAAGIYRVLQDTRNALLTGHADFRALEQQQLQQLTELGFEPEYFQICDPDQLTPATATTAKPVILVAARLGTTRLIDNLQL